MNEETVVEDSLAWKTTLRDEEGHTFYDLQISNELHRKTSWEAQTNLRKLQRQLDEMKNGTYNNPEEQRRLELAKIELEAKNLQLAGELKILKELNELYRSKLNEILK